MFFSSSFDARVVFSHCFSSLSHLCFFDMKTQATDVDDEARIAADLKKLEKEQQKKRKELEQIAQLKRESAIKQASRHVLFFLWSYSC